MLAAQDGGPRRIEVRARPAAVVLVPDQPQTVGLEIEVKAADGSPQTGADLFIHTTAGEVASLEEKAKGRFVAKLLRPADTFPQLAVVTAADISPVVRGNPPWVGSAVVAYSAAIDLKGKTEPHARMRVEIGGGKFGPVKADRQGRFVLPVVVPPGENWARGISTDRLGNSSRSKINMYLPEVRRLHAFVFPDILVATGSDEAWLFAATVSKAGAPQRRSLLVEPNAGRVGQATRLSAGISRVPYRAPSKLGNGKATIRLRTVPAGGVAEIRVQLVAGPPTQMHTSVTPIPAPADGKTPVQVTVTVGDELGNRGTGHGVTLEMDDALVETQMPEPGIYVAELPPRSRAGRTPARVRLEPRSPACPRPRLTGAEGRQQVVDVRGILCAQGVQPQGVVPEQTIAQALNAEIEIVWRLPTPLDIKVEVLSRSQTEIRLRVEATGIDSLDERIDLQTSAGKVRVVGEKKGELLATVRLGAGDARKAVEVVATDQLTGVSTWVRVP